jgi:hypothetical protein
MFYADTPTRGFAVVAAPPRYGICGFNSEFGLNEGRPGGSITFLLKVVYLVER